MQGEPLLVGVDVGTTNIKALIVNGRGQVQARASVPTPTHYPQPGWAYYLAEELWQRTVEALRAVTAEIGDPQSIAGIAFASLAETAVPLDAGHQPTYSSIAWYDRRTEPQAQWLDETIGRDRLFTVCGLPLSHIFGLCKILWLRQHAADAWAHTRLWLNVADYLAFRLSGVAATDYSLASRTLALNLRGLHWADDLLHELDIAPETFAPLLPSGTDLGPILPDAVQTTGLPPRTRVVVGGHDHVCGALAMGVTEPGMALDSIGTSEVVFLPLDAPLSDPQAGRQGYEFGSHVDGRHYYGWAGMRVSGGCADWFRNLFAAEMTYAQLTAEADQIAPGSLGAVFLPHLRSSVNPHLDPKALGAFIGLSTDTPRGALFRAVIEGTSFEMRSALEHLLAHTGTEIERFVAVGGPTRNPLWMRIHAAVLRRTVWVAGMEEAAALGAAMLAGRGAGIYADILDAQSSLSYTATAVVPRDDEMEAYESIYRRVYLPLYGALRPLHHAIHDLQASAVAAQPA